MQPRANPLPVYLSLHSVFRHLIQVDPDTFWFILNELHCPSSFIPSHPDLQPVRLNGMGKARDEYSDNVLKLLKGEFGLSANEQVIDVTDRPVKWS